LKDGFTFEIYLILHSKKLFPGQDEEDKWREIYLLLFPFAESIPGPCKPTAQVKPTDLREAYLAVVCESDGSYILEPSFTKYDTSFEEFCNARLEEEFRRQAGALVSRTVRPLETQLLDQVSNIVYDSQKAITANYPELQNRSFQDYNISQDRNTPFPALQSGMEDIFLATRDHQATTESGVNDLADYQTEPLGQVDIDSLLGFEVPSNTTQQLTNGVCTSDSMLASNSACSSIGICTCHSVIDGQPNTPQSSQIAESTCLTKDPSLASVLQSMTKSLLALEKRLQAIESPT
jgi:hypothetical protein